MGEVLGDGKGRRGQVGGRSLREKGGERTGWGGGTGPEGGRGEEDRLGVVI